MFHYNNICFKGYSKTQKVSWSCITCSVNLKPPFHFLSNKELSNLVYSKQSFSKLLSSKKYPTGMLTCLTQIFLEIHMSYSLT